jgi:hypothetical protein
MVLVLQLGMEQRPCGNVPTDVIIEIPEPRCPRLSLRQALEHSTGCCVVNLAEAGHQRGPLVLHSDETV